MPVLPTYFQIPMSPIPESQKRKVVKPPIKPLLRLEVRDLSEEGARSFLEKVDCATVLQDAVSGVLSLLYSTGSEIPPTRSVTLILRSMGGVAYTTGKDIDDDHKEIHFSTDYISSVPQERRKKEMLGVITHEMVHCWQWAANGTCPGGLIEGIADWVRLRSNLSPPHWKQESTGDWDAGYQHTGYFLDYLEKRFGHGTVVKINERLRNRKYEEEEFWDFCCGHHVKKLWKEYGQSLKGDGETNEEEEVNEVGLLEKEIAAQEQILADKKNALIELQKKLAERSNSLAEMPSSKSYASAIKDSSSTTESNPKGSSS